MYYTTSQYIEETTTTTDVAATYQTYSTLQGGGSYSSSSSTTYLSIQMTNTYYSKYTTLSASSSSVYSFNDTMSTSGSSTVQTLSGTTSTSYSTSTEASTVITAVQGIDSTYSTDGTARVSSTQVSYLYSIMSSVMSSQVDSATASTHSYTISSGTIDTVLTFLSTWQQFGTTTYTSWTGLVITGGEYAQSFTYGTYTITRETYRTSVSETTTTTSSSYSSGGGAAMTSVHTIFRGETETIYYNDSYYSAATSVYTESYGGYKSYRLYSGITTKVMTTVSSSTRIVGAHGAGPVIYTNYYKDATSKYAVTITKVMDNRTTYSTQMWETADPTPATVAPYYTAYSVETNSSFLTTSTSNSSSSKRIQQTVGAYVRITSPWTLMSTSTGLYTATDFPGATSTSGTSTGYTYSQYETMRSQTEDNYTSYSATTYNTSHSSCSTTTVYTFYYCSSSITIASEVMSTVVTDYKTSSTLSMTSTSSSKATSVPRVHSVYINQTINTEYSYSTAW